MGAKIKVFAILNTFYIRSKNCIWRESVFEVWALSFSVLSSILVPTQTLSSFLHSLARWGSSVPGSECFIVSREGGLRECWGVIGRCRETQRECSRNVQVLQSYVRGGGAGIFERSHDKCCSNAQWECWKRQWNEVKKVSFPTDCRQWRWVLRSGGTETLIFKMNWAWFVLKTIKIHATDSSRVEEFQSKWVKPGRRKVGWEGVTNIWKDCVTNVCIICLFALNSVISVFSPEYQH